MVCFESDCFKAIFPFYSASIVAQLTAATAWVDVKSFLYTQQLSLCLRSSKLPDFQDKKKKKKTKKNKKKKPHTFCLYMYWKCEYECDGTLSEEFIFTPTYSAVICGDWLTGSQFFTRKKVWSRCVKHHSTWNPSPYCTRGGWYPRRGTIFSLRGRL